MALEDRVLVASLSKASKGGVVSLSAASKVLGISNAAAAVRIRRLLRRGWLERLRRGLYLVKPLSAAPGQRAIPEDAWLLAREIFSPCYIGGWSAAEHWELTEQIFRSTLVVTAAPVRKTRSRIGGHEFRIFRVPGARLGPGVVRVWRGQERVDVSGLERTLVDGLRNPELVGGGRHLVQILRAYGEHEQRDIARLLDVCRATGSGATWKRLGFLAERLWPHETRIVAAAQRHITTGYVRLDPTIRQRGKLVKRWGLWINISPSVLTADSGAS